MGGHEGLRMVAGVAAAAATLLMGAEAASAATTYTVSGNGDGLAACSGTVCPTLRSAVVAAASTPPATISLGAGTYQLTATALTVASPTVSSGYALTIAGAGPGQTVIEQTGPDRVIDVTGGGPYLFSGVEVTGGHLVAANATSIGADANGAEGGGIYNATSRVDLNNVSITGNTAIGGNGANGSGSTHAGYGGYAYGGGFFDAVPSGSITNSTISGNVATGGNGGSNASGTGAEGAEAYGAGLYAGDITITGSTISHNTATGGNAGSSSNVTGQSGGDSEGGGIGSYDISVATLVNDTITANTALPGLGGAGTTAGSMGYTSGGGIGAEIYDQLGLFNDTITANTATGAYGTGGNLADTYGGSGETIEMMDTVIAGGTATFDSNCGLRPSGFGASYVDLGHNLEDDQPAGSAKPQCEPAGALPTDMIGVAPKLAPLAANGGTTDTELPQAGSPLIRAGGACQYLNASSVLVALTTDQRGMARGSACDVGAVQTQAVTGAAAPQITGSATVGGTLNCNLPSSGFGGDGLSYTYSWLRGGQPISGATNATYAPVAGDAGMSISCSVTATGIVGSPVTTTSAAEPIPAAVVTKPQTSKPQTSKPTIKVTARKLKYSRGHAPIKLRCAGGTSKCSGTITLWSVNSKGKHQKRLVKSTRYTVASGKTKTVKLTLAAATKQLLRKGHGKFKASLQVKQVSGKAVTARVTVT
jgi:hypothetical protein